MNRLALIRAACVVAICITGYAAAITAITLSLWTMHHG